MKSEQISSRWGSESGLQSRTSAGAADTAPRWGWLARLQGIARSWPTRTLGRERRLRTIETLRAGQRGALMLVECDGVRLLVGTGKDGVTAITPIASRQELR